MKLAIDAMPLLSDSRHKEIGRYALNLIVAMSQQAVEHDLVVVLDALDATRLSEARQALRHAGVRAVTATFDYPLGAQPTDYVDACRDTAALLKSRLIESLAPDWLLVTSFLEFGELRTSDFDWNIVEHVAKAVIANDISPLLFPERRHKPGEFLYSRYRDKLERFKQFDLFLAISEATRRDLVEHLGVAPERIRVIGDDPDDSMGLRRKPARAAWEALQTYGGHRNGGHAVSVRRPWRRNAAAIARLADVVPILGVNDDQDEMRVALECVARGERRRILVDISHVFETGLRTGIQRVVRSHCAGLIRLARRRGDFDVEAVAWTETGFIHPRRFVREDLGVDYPGNEESVHPMRNDVLYRPDSAWSSPERFEAFHKAIRDHGGEIVWMVHDLIPIRFPGYCHSGTPPFFRNWLEHAVRNSDGFLCNSESTRADFEEYLNQTLPENARRPWARSVHLGADLESTDLSELSAVVFDLISADTAFFVMVGTIEPRKDYATALAAFERLWLRGINSSLVLVGKQGWDVDNLCARIRNHPQYGDKLHWFENASDRDIRCLLMHAKALLQTSVAEGFGLPVVEAGSLGVPLIVTDIPAFHEIAGNAAAYFPVGDAAALAAIVQEGLGGNGFQRPLDITCLTWKQSTEKLANELLGRQPRRILVDISEVIRLNAWSGVQRVTRNFTVGLSRLAHRLGVFSVEPFAWSEQGIYYAREFGRTQLGIDCPGQDATLEVRSGDVIFMLDSSWWSPERFDDLHRRAREKGGSIVWFVYDLIPIRFPQTCDPGMPLVFRAWIDRAISAADGFICASEAIRLDLEAYMDETLSGNQMRPWTGSLHLGSDLESGRFEVPSQQTIELADQQRPLFVSVGTIEPRKDHATILAAFEILWADNVDASLVLIGKQGWRTDDLTARLRSHVEYGKRLHWFEHATDGDMRYLLGRATALVQASMAEGFGLPLVEAGSLGTPLIVSDIAVFREIAGNEAAYFPVGDVHALVTNLRQVIANHGLPRSAKIVCLSWAQASAKLAEWLMV